MNRSAARAALPVRKLARLAPHNLMEISDIQRRRVA